MDRRSNGDMRVGDLVRTWRRLMCHALAKVIVLDFGGMEVQRYGGAEVRRWMKTQRGTLSKRMGDFDDIRTEVQRWSTEDLYTMVIGLGIGCKYGGAYGKVQSACE